MKQVSAILRDFDRLEINPYFPGDAFLRRVLDQYGYLTFMVFVCPKMRGKYLNTNDKERFMPTEEPKDGLVFPRIPKLQELVAALWRLEIPTKLIFVVGDNGFEVYKGPPIGILLDKQKTSSRRKLYLENLSAQLMKAFYQMIEVVSLGLMKVEAYSGELTIPQDMMDREVSFQRWSFEKYYGGAKPGEQVLREIAELKIRAYAEQGFLVEMADAILVSTEGTDLDTWTQRTEMFQIAGARFPSIYPYIRSLRR